ncbi:uncharacterized protein LOC100839742 [Brachypodium distachyon]|uniref:Uncharacterized protein n=1 Tax=Brachypodium distachyon TaxID=15368 RepID=A0A2K2CSL1_BRADI|nr:uncharacterized protein LOC100839742 [Brachypodium distachyon]PNT65019.1 hypothetical protein BRADI_4g36260v3 [Brachypodium distachyon]|eukprot:XP_003576772.2 uncharacterized protein LOC100839742 [Brachypodium distachyon]
MATMAKLGWCCFFLAVGVVAGQPPPSPSAWTPPPQSEVPSYANGQPYRASYGKPNRIFTCDDDFGKRCVAQCPDLCPKSCFMSCSYCETTCRCVYFPGTSCGDPSFTGGDGNTFYFHGRKDRDFCIVSDADLHVNAHFIGNHNPVNKRNFTWIQALGVSFGNHRLYVGARGAVLWEEEEDHIEINFDGEPITIDTANNAKWVAKDLPRLSVKRTDAVNSVDVELAGVFRISASAVPITDEDSRIHKYGKTEKDSLVHLDLRFKFFTLTDVVDGVLGQTYRPDYINRMNVTANMPIMGGAPKYLSSGLFSTDCTVSKFHRNGATGRGVALSS